MKINAPTMNIAIKNANPAKIPAIAPAIASPKLLAETSIEKLRIMAKESGSRNNKANTVVLLKSNNTPITILNVLDKSILRFHLCYNQYWISRN